MVDLIKREQGRDLSTITRVHESLEPKTLVQRLEEYEGKGKNPVYGPLPTGASPLSKRRESLTPNKGVAKYVKSNWVPGGLSQSAHSTSISSFEAGVDRPGSSLPRLPQSTFNRHGQSSSALPKVTHDNRSSHGITGAREFLPFGALPESDTETMANRRRRLLELKKSLNGAHKERPTSTSDRQVKSPKISRGGRNRSVGTIPFIMPKGSSLVNIPEESSSSNSLGPSLESEALPSSALPTGSQCFKTEEGRHTLIRSGRSTSSSSDLELDSSTPISAPKDLTPTSSLEKLADSRSLTESLRRTSEFG